MHEASYYPPPAFYFDVRFVWKEGNTFLWVKAPFRKVSGIGWSRPTDAPTSADRKPDETRGNVGHLVAKGAPQQLLLERGFPIKSRTRDRLFAGVQAGRVDKLNASISLLDPKGNPSIHWMVFGLVLGRYDVSEFASTSGDVVIETLSFQYSHFEMEVPSNGIDIQNSAATREL